MNNLKVNEIELKQLYKKLPEIKRYLQQLGCKVADAEDIFQEALLIYVRKKEDPAFILTVDALHYVKSTCKLLWYNQARKIGKQVSVEISEEIIAEENSTWFQHEMALRMVEQTLEKLGEQCQELLQLFYGLGWNMIDIAKKIGLRNDKVAKAQKYRCIQKAKEIAMEQNHSEY
jgi:RNA polymerase sigma factor (sigma-70 family)